MAVTTRAELAWFNYTEANKRIDRCKAAFDRAGQVIAESQAQRWLTEFLNESWDVEASAANDRAYQAGPTA